MSLSILHRRRLQQAVNTTPNTFIGGVASTIPDKTTLANKLGISESDIGYFNLVGNDIEAAINVNYTIPDYFMNDEEGITKYIDTDGKVSRIGIYAFRVAYQREDFVEASFPNCTSIGGTSFRGCWFLIKLELPSVTDFGGTTGDDNVFSGGTSNQRWASTTLYINSSVQNDGDITKFTSQGGNVIVV